jgi:hypothetical protein
MCMKRRGDPVSIGADASSDNLHCDKKSPTQLQKTNLARSEDLSEMSVSRAIASFNPGASESEGCRSALTAGRAMCRGTTSTSTMV